MDRCTRSSSKSVAAGVKENKRGASQTTTPPPPKRRKKSKKSNAGVQAAEERFDPESYLIFHRAHGMVETLVNTEGPYRAKLVDLAAYGIARDKNGDSLTPNDVIAEAWKSVGYFWAEPSTNKVLSKDPSCVSFASMGKSRGDDGKTRCFPTIAISACFKDNDYRAEEAATLPSEIADMSKEDKKTLLLFFRKIKHKFLHVVHRFVTIKYKRYFRKSPKATPRGTHQ